MKDTSRQPETVGNSREEYPETGADAGKIVSILFSLIERPSTVVDVGGGTGAWARVFKDQGVAKVYCIDHPSVLNSDLLIDRTEFIQADFEKELPPVIRCDLAVCTEVVEHLSGETAVKVIDFLTKSADRILFSAALPGQPSSSHCNEQLSSYWKQLFAERGYERYDILRPRIQADKQISYWYRQNLFLFASKAGRSLVRFKDCSFACLAEDFELVHESVLAAMMNKRGMPGIRESWKLLCRAVRQRLGLA